MSALVDVVPHGALAVGGGDAGALLRSIDWSRTALGPITGWPATLRTGVGIMLSSQFPMRILWGPEFVMLHNDAYRPVLGARKYPHAMGRPTAEQFPEVWSVVGPMFARVLAGEAIALEDAELPLERNGYREECYFTLSYSPLSDDRGGVGGVLGVVHETTLRVLAERRLRTLRKLAQQLAAVQRPDAVCQSAAEVLAEAARDIPFALIYLCQEGTSDLQLVAAAGLPPEHAARDALADPAGTVWLTGAEGALPHVVHGIPRLLGPLCAGPFPEPIESAVVLPLIGPGRSERYGFLVAGVSPRRTLDAEYQAFFELCAGHLATAIANASAFEFVKRERERAEDARRTAESASRAKDEFIAIVSHELRNPLNAILGWTRLLRSAAIPSERVPNALEIIERNGVNQAQLIEELLDTSRAAAGKLHLQPKRVSFAHVVEAAIESARPALHAKGLHLHADVAEGPIVHGDPARLQQVVWNLLTNATKFTPRGGLVSVVVGGRGSHVEMSVSDTGQGIPAAFLGHVFERFKQADGSTTRAHGGLGLGLAIAKSLVEMHGGTIEAHSAGDGQGATFSVRLPLAHPLDTPAQRTSTPHSAHDAARSAPSELAGLRVLVVDDDEDARDLVSTVLASWGASVTVTTSAPEALSAFEPSPPDVLLSDIGMPGEDGYTLIAQVRARPHRHGGATPAACLTGYVTAEDRRRALSAGFQMHLPKPVDPAELVAVVSNLGRMARAVRGEH